MPPLSSSADATPVEQQILARMRRAGRGSVWHAGRLRGLAPRNTLDQSLGRLEALNDEQSVPLVPSGAYACYLLGLIHTQPTEVVLLSADTTRVIQLADVVIRIRPAAPRYLQCAGRTSGILIQALRHLGDGIVNDEHVLALRQQLSMASRKALLRDIECAPAWMHQWFRRIAEE